MKKLFTLLLFLSISIITFTSYAQTDCNPATITKVEPEGTGNRINWTLPPSGEEVLISQNEDSKGLPSGFYEWSLGVYHRFTPEHLATINGGILTQIVFVPSYRITQTEPGHTYTVQVYQGGVWGAEEDRNHGTLISFQELNNDDLLFNEENTITLETPVTIDALEEIWIGYFCTNIDSIQSEMKAPAGRDNSPCNNEFGNIMFFDNQWITSSELYGSCANNWVIKGKVQTIENATVNIFFNGNEIESNFSGITYFHSNPTGEEHCYEIEVNCLEGGISPLSNKECIPGVGINDNEIMNGFIVYPNPAGNELRITNYELRNGSLSEVEVEIFDVYGRKVNSKFKIQNSEFVIDVSSLSSGIYFIRLMNDTESFVQKFVKK